ncbi:histidine phosphatase family protein [Streptococcus gordonii]|uniref:histidine phosphatase family protein n=1 Tax=Streptococcus gordonii TaxID=1302 RepID=UPI001CBEF0D2|nr:histidine phosphatase family protein [Streptococcus gordonii]MBZ2132636.1 phosphoglycerate mutase family protein [Streptococcus gordonii]MBZ2141043.1 phosphoglycerate mutase family protein [Streptococcus gordonii]MBZ2143835.1 phosphoglycerate mutase family protein [Streptococcus gordonii]MBZ2145794.1 phosphoglycerate mutase family protein [Streptococcus gordonii]
MKIIFIRHGEPDYSLLEEAGYTGFGLDLAPLSVAGRRMATEAAANPLLEQAEILISSSVTRALETASYLIRDRQLPLFVEPLLHEWQVYESGIEKFEQARELFFENNGCLPTRSPVQYETADQMKARFFSALSKYRDYETVALVAHRMLIRQFVADQQIDFCQFVEYELKF